MASTHAEQPAKVVALRRLTEAQYRNVIADTFGEDVKFGGRFESIVRPDHGLLAVGASQSRISAAGMENYDEMARTIAAQVLDERHRGQFLSCTPADAATADADCARQFLRRVGTYLYRRPLTSAEVEFYAGLAGKGAGPLKSFYKGLELSLASMLIAPEFLYRVESVGSDGVTLDSFSKASRLSFLVWNSGPDRLLLDAATRGELETSDGLKAQVDRLLRSPKAEKGLRAFFSDFLHLDRVEDLSKDTVVYGKFTTLVAADLKEQILRLAVDELLTQDNPYTDIFTTRKTYVNRRLGLLYSIPVSSADGWEPYTIPEGDERAGLLGQGAFLALYAHEGRSSPTLRGRAVREVFLCQPVPDPPANVDFAGFNDTSDAVMKTARQRLTRHNTDPVCASCHQITDPLGLPLERFDGAGQYRIEENGVRIDARGSFEGNSFDGAAALGYLMSRSPAVTECFASRMAEYAVGRTADDLPSGWVESTAKAFQGGAFRYRHLIKAIALSPDFISVRNTTAAPTHVAYAPGREIREAN